MPKNQFQRPLPIKHDHKVPRHGAALPTPKPVGKRLSMTKAEKPALPTLDALLSQIERH